MSKYSFNVLTETTPSPEYDFRGAQAGKAAANSVVRVFDWRDIRGNLANMPKYVKEAIEAAGLEMVYLGGTTYSHSVIGLRAK